MDATRWRETVGADILLDNLKHHFFCNHAAVLRESNMDFILVSINISDLGVTPIHTGKNLNKQATQNQAIEIFSSFLRDKYRLYYNVYKEPSEITATTTSKINKTHISSNSLAARCASIIAKDFE